MMHENDDLGRYVPTRGGILDRKTGVATAREYTPTETLDTVAWLNERARGYPPAGVGSTAKS